MNDKRNVIVVTGASGYISRIFIRYLEERGYEVLRVDKKHPDTPLGISEEEFLENILSTKKAGQLKAIVHLAADSLLGPSVTDPITYYENNVGESTAFLYSLIKNEILSKDIPFLFASSAAVYGNNRGWSGSILDLNCLQPINPYGRTKLMFEQILHDSAYAYDLRIASFRFFNVVGGYQELAQDLDQPHLITSLCRAAIEKTPFIVNGDNFTTEDRSPVRDFVHVLDVCSALLARIESPVWSYFESKEKQIETPYHVYEVASGTPISVSNVVKYFDSMYSKLNIQVKDARPGDPSYLVGSPSSLELNFGWQRQYTLADAVTSAIHAYKEQGLWGI